MTLAASDAGSATVGDALMEAATVVIVDDHEPNLTLLRRILTDAGVSKIHASRDPGEVVALCTAAAPDLVLLDLHMPGMDGVATMQALRSVACGDDDFLPVVVLTADATVEARRRALAAGASDFLVKPLNRDEVVLRCRNLLHTRFLHRRTQEHNHRLRTEIAARNAVEEKAAREVEAMRARVRSAIDSGGPRMVFQPIAEVDSRRTVAYEALARFDQAPSRTPDVWFDEAARVGLSAPLELSAVANALDVLPHLPADAALTINISPEVVTGPDLAPMLDRADIRERVVVEITEHLRIADYGSLVAALDHLRAGGLRVAVDDAGAGFASLQHILRLRPDIIKLDIGLVRDIDTDPVKRSLAAALVNFAEETGATLIAEGVETAAELATLTGLGVRWAQGYHLGRPAPLPPR